MKIKKIIAGLSAMAIASAMSLSALAAAEPQSTTITNESENKAGNMTATYTVSPGYMVTIPAGAVIADSEETATAQQIRAENVLLGDGKKLVVTLTGATNTTEENAAIFNAKNGDSTVKYSIKAGEYAVTLGGEVASFENKAEAQTVDVKFIKDTTSTPTTAGDHTEQLTFTISVENASTPLDTNTTAWTAGTFAVPAGGLTYSAAVTVSGDVTLVLTDGETLTLNKGISIADGATLTVEGNGTMNVNGSNNSTASTVAGKGTLVLNNGTLNAKGGKGADVSYRFGLQGAAGGAAINGSVTINGGNLTATGGNGGSVYNADVSSGGAGGAAINGALSVNGGLVTTQNGSAGTIGGGCDECSAGAGGKAVTGTVTDNR